MTVQALGVFAASLAELTLVQDTSGDLPLHHLCRNATCDIGLIKKLGSDTSAYAAINDVRLIRLMVQCDIEMTLFVVVNLAL